MTAQSSSPRRTALGGNGLLVVISAATIVTVAVEGAFISVASWTLLPAIMVLLVLMAVGVVSAVGRLIDDGEVAVPRVPEATPEPTPAAAAPAPPSAPSSWGTRTIAA